MTAKLSKQHVASVQANKEAYESHSNLIRARVKVLKFRYKRAIKLFKMQNRPGHRLTLTKEDRNLLEEYQSGRLSNYLQEAKESHNNLQRHRTDLFKDSQRAQASSYVLRPREERAEHGSDRKRRRRGGT